MDTSSSSITKMAITMITAIIVVGAVLIPLTDDLKGTSTTTEERTITNSGDLFFASVDGNSHTMEIALDGTNYTVTTDGTAVRSLEVTQGSAKANPFNVYYVAMNLDSGDNADDSGETRLSKEKGAIAYILDPNNLKRTLAGYTFDTTLYNVMLVIPPVYWYSNGTDTLYIASTPDAFDGLTLKDYAHTYTDNRTGGTGQTGHSSAIAIGVYEAYNLNGTLVSQSDRTPTANTNYRTFINLAKVNNTDNDHSVYGLWNWFDYTLYRIMCWTVMGNTDSQYMMGWGPTATGSSTVTGLTSAGYTKSADNQSPVCLFIENSWGSLDEYLGDTSALSASGELTWKAGNSLNQPINYNTLVNVLEGNYVIKGPSGIGTPYQTVSQLASDGFGLPVYKTGSSTPSASGEGINDMYGTNVKNKCPVSFGGAYFANLYEKYGLSDVNPGYATYADDWTSASGASFGTRIYCHILNDDNLPTIEDDYAYVMQLENTTSTTIENVSVRDGGQMVSKMPTGTTLNEYWDLGGEGSAPSIGDPSLTSVDIAVGEGALATLYSNGIVRVHTSSGHVDTSAVTSDNPVTFTITDTLAFTDSINGQQSVPVSVFAGDGDMVQTQMATVRSDTPILYATYLFGATAGDQTADYGYVVHGTPGNPVVDVIDVDGSDAEDSAVVLTTSDAEDDSLVLTTATVTTEWENGSSETILSDVIVAKEISYTVTVEGEGGGITSVMIGIIPVFVILGILIYVVQYLRVNGKDGI